MLRPNILTVSPLGLRITQIGWRDAIQMGRQSSRLIALTLIQASGGPNTTPYGRCVAPAMYWVTDCHVDCSACIALVLGTAWLLVLYPSFRKACAIVLGAAAAIPVLVYGIAEVIAFEQRHRQAA